MKSSPLFTHESPPAITLIDSSLNQSPHPRDGDANDKSDDQGHDNLVGGNGNDVRQEDVAVEAQDPAEGVEKFGYVGSQPSLILMVRL